MEKQGCILGHTYFDIDELSDGKQQYSASHISARSIENVLHAHGANGRVIECIQGRTFECAVVKPDLGVRVSSITSLKEELQVALEHEISFVVPWEHGIGIVLHYEGAELSFKYALQKASLERNSGSFLIGMTALEEARLLKLAECGNVLISGPDTGEKQHILDALLLQVALYYSPDRMKLVLVSDNPSCFQDYSALEHILIPRVTDSSFSSVMSWLYDESQRRLNLLKAHNSEFAIILVFIGDFEHLLKKLSSDQRDTLYYLLRNSLKFGYTFICNANRPTADKVSGLAKSFFTTRLSINPRNAMDEIVALGSSYISLPNENMFLLKTSFSDEPEKLFIPKVSETDVQKLKNWAETGILDENSCNLKVINMVNDTKRIPTRDASYGDELFEQMGRQVIESQKASIGMLQRYFKVGFNRAASTMDRLIEAGVVSKEDGTKPRTVLMTMEEFESMLANGETNSSSRNVQRKTEKQAPVHNAEHIIDPVKTMIEKEIMMEAIDNYDEKIPLDYLYEGKVGNKSIIQKVLDFIYKYFKV